MKYPVILAFTVLSLTQSAFSQGKAIRIGAAAPEIALPQPDGKTITLSSLKGALVLVDFWATWCGPCVQEQPELKKIYQQFDSDVKKGKFQILGVSLDRKRENWEKGIERLKITWPQVSDLKYWTSPVADTYSIEALPFNVIVDEKGNIAAINLHGPELRNFIDKHLKKNK